MNDKVLRTLEYDKILEKLMLRASCCISRELVECLEPKQDFSEIQADLELTQQAEGFYRRNGYSPVDDFPDMREVLKRLHAVLFLPPAELLKIASCLKAARVARNALTRENTGAMLENLSNSLITYDYIEQELNRCILNEDELCDSASPALSRIRKQMRLANEKVREKLNSIIRSTEFQKYLQEPIITVRNGRYVVPVKLEYRSQVPGLIHDQSGSGATLFIEPTSVVELGNEYKKYLAEEAAEVERILSELTAMIAPSAKEIYNNLLVLGEIDLAFAKAKLAREMSAICPKLNSKGQVKIIKGRHPLINPDQVVPIDIWIGYEFKTLIITGPNTGGKTVTLKTVGLFTLMAMSGLFVPANEGTELSVFQNVFADIGDEQSIEQSLSTFSSHMKNIVGILKEADRDSLILLDELGAGTDPVEGAALAMSILETLHEVNCIALATTHYSEIKAFALSRDGMENASMEFDINKLCPTYRLFVGIPGKSNAFEISKRLGLSDTVIEKARVFLKKEDINFEDIITSADHARKIAERERELAEATRHELSHLRSEAEAQRKKNEQEYETHKKKAKEEAKRIVADTKRETEALVKSLRVLKNLSSEDKKLLERSIQNARDNIRNMEESLHDTPQEAENIGEPLTEVNLGDTVKILSLNQVGTVLTLPDSKNEVQLQVGIMKLSAKLSDLRVAAPKAPKKEKSSVVLQSKSVGLELDIRGSLVDEAIPVVDAYIEDAHSAGLSEVNIIHGKGTGALRAGIQSYLKSHKRVQSYRMGSYGQGDAGVTVVTLKK
ncbi:MAG: endonuclease MutS2 [Clostridiales bacterium]|nr:endonuclease MutS2 [Clostridiales bacterium]